jgi:methyl-accepting chemotaxis protein
MTYAAPRQFAPALQTGDPLAQVVSSVETCYLHAGEHLGAAVDTLRDTKALFARLDASLDVQAAQYLADLSARAFGKVAELPANFERVLQQNTCLRAMVRDVRFEVGDLDRVVRTIANVSVNARILGNALTRPHPQVNSFVVRLAEMSAEAETILRDMKEAMGTIGHEARAMEESLQDLRVTLTRNVLPDLSSFAAIARNVQDSRAELTAGTETLSAQMRAVFSEVSRLVVALQSGDSTRQRLQRVQDSLTQISGQGGGLDAVLIDLARALLDAARQDADTELQVSVTALDAVQHKAAAALTDARRFYLTRVDHASDNTHTDLDAGFAAAHEHLITLQARADALAGQLDIILQHESTIRKIAQQVRLSGLNAVLICAKLGEEGRALRELAQWLRALSDESDQIVTRLQGNLAQTRQSVRDLGENGVDPLQSTFSGFLHDAEALRKAMGQIETTVSDAARGFDVAGRSLPVQISHAAGQLLQFQRSLAELHSFSDTLGRRGAGLVRPATGFSEGAPEAQVLASLRKRYTMQQERVIHDAIVKAVAPTVVACPSSIALAAPVEDESLDDILF